MNKKRFYYIKCSALCLQLAVPEWPDRASEMDSHDSGSLDRSQHPGPPSTRLLLLSGCLAFVVTYDAADRWRNGKACTGNETTIRIRPEQMSVQSKQLQTVSVCGGRLSAETAPLRRLSDVVRAPAVHSRTDSTTRGSMYAVRAHCSLVTCVSAFARVRACVLECLEQRCC